MSTFLVDYLFADRLYPNALAAIAHIDHWGPTVILTDGDVVFQPRKVQRSGLWQAIEGRVLIYIHKEAMLQDVVERYPARQYVLIDDKLRILANVNVKLMNRLTTVFAKQGHYANGPNIVSKHGRAHLVIERIGDLLQSDCCALFKPSRSTTAAQESI